jgi:hypothetical protein
MREVEVLQFRKQQKRKFALKQPLKIYDYWATLTKKVKKSLLTLHNREGKSKLTNLGNNGSRSSDRANTLP